MLYSKTCEYAIRTLSVLAEEKDRFIGAYEISENAGISSSYVAKICQALVQKKFLKSKTGRLGGFMLNKKAHDIIVMDIVDALESCWVFENCLMGLADCSDNNPCPIHVIWKEAKEEIRTTFENITLLDVAKKVKHCEYRPFARSQLKT